VFSRTSTKENARFEKFQREPKQGLVSLSCAVISRPRLSHTGEYQEKAWLIRLGQWCNQARRQDIAAGGAKKLKEGPKTRRGGHILKILY